MQKRKKGRKFSRERDQRKAFLRALATALVSNEKIKTTEARAKEVSVFLEKLIAQAKKGNLSSRRRLAGFFSKETSKKIMDEIAPRYKNRPGGYTRIIKLGPRKSDGAEMAIIEFIK